MGPIYAGIDDYFWDKQQSRATLSPMEMNPSQGWQFKRTIQKPIIQSH
jgi:hypothetical protein